MKKENLIRRFLGVSGFLVFLTFSSFVFLFRPYSFGDPPQIPRGWGYNLAPKYLGSPQAIRSIEFEGRSIHPFLSPTNSSNMHVDAYASDVHPTGGSLGVNPLVRSLANGAIGGQCATLTFDQRGNIVAVCATFKEFRLLLIDPLSLKILAQMSLPSRSSNKSLNLRKIMSDTSGGAYFFLDHKDRAVLVDAHQTLKVIGQEWIGQIPRFVVEHEYSFKELITAASEPSDAITSILPDWNGRYWFVSRLGLIGYLDIDDPRPFFIKLEGEEIQNSFALDQNHIYVVSDRALYALKLGISGDIEILWKEEYERAEARKTGTITLGSGTTPTLLGDHYVAIADNADPQINVLIYRRNKQESDDQFVCKVPVFSPGASSTENTLIGVNNSLIIENNYGYDLFPTMMFGRVSEGGVSRIDINESEQCFIKWTNPIISQTTVPKLSAENGLIYLYTKKPNIGIGVDAYYLSTVDFETGETVFEVLAGTGVGYDNNWSPITLGESRCTYVGVLRGLVSICDQN